MAFKDILILCKKHLGLIVAIPVVVGLITAFVCWFIMPDEYTSSKKIYVLANDDRYIAALESARWNEQSEMNWGINYSQQLCNDVAELVKSSRIRDAVSNDVGVESLDKYDIEVESSEKNRVITLNVTAYNPEMAARIVESLAIRTAELSKQVTDAESVNIIDDTKVPEALSGPPRFLITAVAFIIALFVGLVVMLTKDVMDTTIKSRNDLVRAFKHPILTTNPKVRL